LLSPCWPLLSSEAMGSPRPVFVLEGSGAGFRAQGAGCAAELFFEAAAAAAARLGFIAAGGIAGSSMPPMCLVQAAERECDGGAERDAVNEGLLPSGGRGAEEAAGRQGLATVGGAVEVAADRLRREGLGRESWGSAVVATPGVAGYCRLDEGDEKDGLPAGEPGDWFDAWFDEPEPIQPVEVKLPPIVLPEQVKAWCEQVSVDPEEPGMQSDRDKAQLDEVGAMSRQDFRVPSPRPRAPPAQKEQQLMSPQLQHGDRAADGFRGGGRVRVAGRKCKKSKKQPGFEGGGMDGGLCFEDDGVGGAGEGEIAVGPALAVAVAQPRAVGLDAAATEGDAGSAGVGARNDAMAAADQAGLAGIRFPQMPGLVWKDLGHGSVRGIMQRWRDEQTLATGEVRSLYRDICAVIQQGKALTSGCLPWRSQRGPSRRL